MSVAFKVSTDSQIKPKVVSPVRLIRADQAHEKSVKMLLYGDTGTGKTRAILGLLDRGLKILYFSTEIGGSGLLTVELEATQEQMQRLYKLEGLNDYQTIVKFLRKPDALIPEIYDLDLDLIFWDGFSEGQLVHLEEYIGEEIHAKNPKDESDARSSGLQLETRDWTMVLNGTVRMATDFLLMYNVKTGKPWHKVLTCKEVEKERVEDPANSDSKPKYRAKNTMLLHGGAKKLVEGGFDLILRTRVKTSALKPDERTYIYACAASESQTAKSRGIKLPSELGADMGVVWDKVKEQARL